MIGKIKSRKDGYLLVEILISMSIFSVLVFVISVFLKRIVIVEKAKKNNQKMYEKMYFSMDKIVLDIKNRDIRKFSYEKENNDIFIRENLIVFKLNEIFYKIEYEKGKTQEEKINVEIKRTDEYFINESGKKEYIFEIKVDKIKDYYFPDFDKNS